MLPDTNMRNYKHSIALAMLVLLAPAGANSARAHEYKAGNLVLHQPWTRATPAGATVAGGYLSIENDRMAADKLVGGSFSRASGFEIHQMATVDGVMTMRPL